MFFIKKINTNNTLISFIILTIILLLYLIYKQHTKLTIEGFKNNKLKKFKNNNTHKNKKDFNANNLKYYGYKTHSSNKKEDFIDTTSAKKRKDGTLIRKLRRLSSNKSKEDFSDTKDTQLEKSRKLLEKFREKNEDPGSRDNFQNVMDEIDKIDPTAFTFNSMGNTISRYSENLDNRIKYAKKQNNHSRLDSNMAQLKVLLDEGKKLFLFKNVI